MTGSIGNPRMTPLVKAVQNCCQSVVNLRGRKTVPAESSESSNGQKLKQVNGMGTGIIIDSRGYVLTNYHVVQGVKEIEVTTSENEKTTAQLLAHDPVTDLAILKIQTRQSLPRIEIGTSSDLMLAETVTAVGNAYGYEHTVTVGIISQLGRTVQVNDHQIYRNLIQTDAAINPGNSGGPLLNMDGKMIGINVAVRIGAQGIAFAIPVNDALEVAADLMSQLVSDEIATGFTTESIWDNDHRQLVIQSIDVDSLASRQGLSRGDQIVAINGKQVETTLDYYAALLELQPEDELELLVRRDHETLDISYRLSRQAGIHGGLAWDSLGVKLNEVDEVELSNKHPNYKRGLKVTRIRPGSPAEQEGILPGDVIVAMHGYKTESLENLAYVLQSTEIAKRESFMFYILRDKEPFWGQMRVAQLTTH